jgi:hypothetical protein
MRKTIKTSTQYIGKNIGDTIATNKTNSGTFLSCNILALNFLPNFVQLKWYAAIKAITK